MQHLMKFQGSGVRCRSLGVNIYSMGHGAEGMGSFEFGSGNAEFGKSETKHETLNTALTLNPKSAIRNPKLKGPEP
jgi:hypothetical protein